jgi:hypothetical protein
MEIVTCPNAPLAQRWEALQWTVKGGDVLQEAQSHTYWICAIDAGNPILVSLKDGSMLSPICTTRRFHTIKAKLFVSKE